MQKIEQIYIFDIDGVLTDINSHKIEISELIDFIVKILEKEEPIAFNTGRPLSWVKEELLSKIEGKINNKSLLNNLFAVVEKGGEWIQFNKKGDEIVNIDKSIKIPRNLESALRELIDEKFKGRIFYDNNKKTMATLQKSDEISLNEFNSFHSELNHEIEKILLENDLEHRFKYVPTTLDTDIESVKVGKDFAMGKILEWLKIKNFSPNIFVAFGDSISDLEMAKHLYEKGHKVEFVYVGEAEFDESSYGFPIIFTNEKYDKGALEYLQTH